MGLSRGNLLYYATARARDIIENYGGGPGKYLGKLLLKGGGITVAL
jgi:hypothetical protein